MSKLDSLWGKAVLFTLTVLVGGWCHGQTYSWTNLAGGFDSNVRLGDGGPATSEILRASELAVDTRGNLFLSERGCVYFTTTDKLL